MRKLVIICAFVAVILLLSVNGAQAGTLDRGVKAGPFFFAGGGNGNPMITQLKYQMAVDARVGLTNRYTTVTNSYNTYNGNVAFNTFDATISGGTFSGGTVNFTSTFNVVP